MPLPTIDAKKFTQICNDWLALFPEYKKKEKGLFSKMVGPFQLRIFIEVMSFKDKYRPLSSLCPMFVELPDFVPAFLTTKNIENGFIGWQGHITRNLYEKAAYELREKTPFPLEGTVSVSQILNAYEQKAGASGFFIEDVEAPALLCGWCSKPDQAIPWIEWGREKYLASYRKNVAYKESIKGTPEDEMYTVKTTLEHIDQWTEGMHRRVQDTDYLRDLVETQIKKFKYDKIPRYDLTIDI